MKLVGSDMLAVLLDVGLLRREQDGDYTLTPAGDRIVYELQRDRLRAARVPAYREIRAPRRARRSRS